MTDLKPPTAVFAVSLVDSRGAAWSRDCPRHGVDPIRRPTQPRPGRQPPCPGGPPTLGGPRIGSGRATLIKWADAVRNGGNAALRPRLIAVTIFFIAMLWFVGNLAWATAAETTDPWFSPTVTMYAYSITLVAGSLLALLLTAHGAARAGRLDDALMGIDLRIRLLPTTWRTEAGNPRKAPSGGALAPGQGPAPALEGLDKSRAGYPAAVEAALQPQPSEALDTVARLEEARLKALRWELLAQKQAVVDARRALWPAMTGPIAVSMLFVAIASVMLPGSEGFATAHFQLNTTLVLFLAYGLPLLLLWAVIAVSFVSGSLREVSRREQARRRGGYGA